MCEDYRAGATFDFALDEADRGSQRIACPVLVLWGGRGRLPELYDDVLGIWRAWADDVTLWTAATRAQPRAYYAWLKLGQA